MPIPGLTIIGERINPGFSSSRSLIEGRDLPALAALAREQVRKGASLINLNAGTDGERDVDFAVALLRVVQEAVDVPLSLDSPALHVQKAVHAAYDRRRCGGTPPILNSVAETRWELMDLYHRFPCRILLMASERLEHGKGVANRSGTEVHETARRLVQRACREHPTLTHADLIVDVSLCPVASDTENSVRTALNGIALVTADPELRGVRMSVGLSNLSIMLPTRTARNGMPLKLAIESAFLTLAIPRGLDMALATAGRPYRLLAADDPVLLAFQEVIAADGYEALAQLRALYAA